MTYEQAVEKANSNKGPAIVFEHANTAKRLVGKTLTSKQAGNTNRMEIVESVNNNYILRINGGDYNISPVAWVLQNLGRMNVE